MNRLEIYRYCSWLAKQEISIWQKTLSPSCIAFIKVYIDSGTGAADIALKVRICIVVSLPAETELLDNMINLFLARRVFQ